MHYHRTVLVAAPFISLTPLLHLFGGAMGEG
jgi:hypothetical protein